MITRDMQKNNQNKHIVIPPKGIKISQMAEKTALTGTEFLPYQEEATNGKISTEALKDYVMIAVSESLFYPDEEDITAVDNKLKLKDKSYDSEEYSGIGRIMLRKNMVDNVNILTQDMLSESNTIYIVQYDYDLNGQTISIPEGCFLDFRGGSFTNGSIVYNGETIDVSNVINSIPYFNKEQDKPLWWNGSEWVTWGDSSDIDEDAVNELIKEYVNSSTFTDSIETIIKDYIAGYITEDEFTTYVKSIVETYVSDYVTNSAFTDIILTTISDYIDGDAFKQIIQDMIDGYDLEDYVKTDTFESSISSINQEISGILEDITDIRSAIDSIEHPLQILSQDEYAALSSKDENVLYCIKG